MLAGLLAAAAGHRARAQDQDLDEDLPIKGAPKGRIGGASRGPRKGDPVIVLEVLAPARSVGETASPAPTLFYRCSDAIALPMRFTVSLRGQALPVIDVPIAAPRTGGLQAVPTAALGLRLVPELVYVWSISAIRDPDSPSNDLVASALLRVRRTGAQDEVRLRAATPAQLAEAGFWYDAVAAAEGSSRAALLRQEGLDAAGG